MKKGDLVQFLWSDVIPGANQQELLAGPNISLSTKTSEQMVWTCWKLR